MHSLVFVTLVFCLVKKKSEVTVTDVAIIECGKSNLNLSD